MSGDIKCVRCLEETHVISNWKNRTTRIKFPNILSGILTNLKLAAQRNGKLSHKTIWRQFIKSVEKCWRLILNPD